MPPTSEPIPLIEDIDIRQNDVLAKLDDLNEQIERLLNNCRPTETDDKSVVSQDSESQGLDSQLNLDDRAAPISQSPAAA
jgi:hypothetical protein